MTKKEISFIKLIRTQLFEGGVFTDEVKKYFVNENKDINNVEFLIEYAHKACILFKQKLRLTQY